MPPTGIVCSLTAGMLSAELSLRGDYQTTQAIYPPLHRFHKLATKTKKQKGVGGWGGGGGVERALSPPSKTSVNVPVLDMPESKLQALIYDILPEGDARSIRHN